MNGRLALDRLFDEFIQSYSFTLKFNFAAGDSRHIEQIIHEANHVHHLALDHFGGLVDFLSPVVAQPQEFQCVADWSQRVP